MRHFISLIVIILWCTTLLSQPRRGIAFWDVDRLYDTLPALFYDDSKFTPEGDQRWNSKRYNLKIKQVAATLDSMQMPIVALYGIENEDVVKEIIEHTNQDYSYIHRTRNSFDGMDLALLYYGDMLFPEKITTQRDFLYVECELNEKPLNILICCDGRDIYDFEPLLDSRTQHTIILGRVYEDQIEKFTQPLNRYEAKGWGNASSYRGWYLRHRIGIGDSIDMVGSGIYIAPHLLTPERTKPLPTFNKYSYQGGTSAYLPIYIYVE